MHVLHGYYIVPHVGITCLEMCVPFLTGLVTNVFVFRSLVFKLSMAKYELPLHLHIKPHISVLTMACWW